LWEGTRFEVSFRSWPFFLVPRCFHDTEAEGKENKSVEEREEKRMEEKETKRRKKIVKGWRRGKK
jgi:hypothetical protein